MNLVLVARGLPAPRLRQLGARHSRTRLHIGPERYAGWVDCLLATLAQHDPALDAALREECHEVLENGIAVMRSYSLARLTLLGFAALSPTYAPPLHRTRPNRPLSLRERAGVRANQSRRLG